MLTAPSQSTPDPVAAIPPVRISTEPVTGEIVGPAPAVSPLRFGLRTLFAIMAVSSVQCALMSYLGVLVGLAVGTAACILAFSGLLCVGMLFSAAGAAQQVQRLDRFVVWLMMAIVTLILGTTLAGGGAVVLTILAEARSQAWVQSAIGLTLQPTYVIEDTDALLSQHVAFVIPGSAADQAGLSRGDIVLWDGERSNFAEMLEKNRGKDVELTVTTSPLNLAGQAASKRTVTLSVPK